MINWFCTLNDIACTSNLFPGKTIVWELDELIRQGPVAESDTCNHGQIWNKILQRKLKELSWTSRFESWEFVIIKLMLPCKWYPLSFSVKFKAAITFTLVLWNALTFSLHVYHLATTHKILNFEHSKSLQKFYKIFLNFSIINFSQSINLNLTVK